MDAWIHVLRLDRASEDAWMHGTLPLQVHYPASARVHGRLDLGGGARVHARLDVGACRLDIR